MIEETEYCMHWSPRYERDEVSVTRICDECGSYGSVPRCTGTTLKGEQCQVWALEGDTCSAHTPEALARRRERKAAEPVGQPSRLADLGPGVCNAITRAGEACGNYPRKGTRLCFYHRHLEAA